MERRPGSLLCSTALRTLAQRQVFERDISVFFCRVFGHFARKHCPLATGPGPGRRP